ncbi:MAG: HNH endonuclease domain-containing protein [Spirochaetota bacterium]
MTGQLPPSERVPVGTLLRLFSSRTNSYKYLFFLALIRRLAHPEVLPTNRIVPLHELLGSMLAIAWYPVFYFKLSFGARDTIPISLRSLPELQETVRPGTPQHFTELTEHYSDLISRTDLHKYVPYRLIRPFFTKDLRGLPDGQVNKTVAELAFSHFDSAKPLYYIDQERTHIVLHTEWLNYFLANRAIVEKWVLWEWMLYMQRCNPSVPNIASKLIPPNRRSPLSTQRSYWSRVIASTSKLHCPYSGKRLDTTFVLDHVIPWSFVVHDRIWNLVPTTPEANSIKSDKLPPEESITAIGELHVLAAETSRELLSETQWKKQLEPYLTDLHMPSYNMLCNLSAFQPRYYNHLRSLLNLARSQGFS